MFKRLFWFTLGAGAGIEASRRLQRKLRDTRDQYRPEHIVRRLGTDLRLAVDEGKRAMAERENQLRARQGRRYADPLHERL